MTRLEYVLRVGLAEQEARARAAAATDAKAKTLAKKVEQQSKESKESKSAPLPGIAKPKPLPKPAPKPSEDVLESLRYTMMTSTETLDRATGVALEFASTFLPAPSSKTAWCLLKWIFINKFLEESKAVPAGTFNDFYVAAEQMMCYLQFSEDTEEVNWEDFVDMVDGSAPTESEGMDVSASMSSMNLSDLPEIGVRMPLRGRTTIGEDHVIKESARRAASKWKSFKRFLSKNFELSATFVAYVKAAFASARRARAGAQAGARAGAGPDEGALPAGLEDPEDLVDLMHGNAASFIAKVVDVVTTLAPHAIYMWLESKHANLLDSSTVQDDEQWRSIISGWVGMGGGPRPIDPTAPVDEYGEEWHFFKQLMLGEEGILSTLNIWGLWSFGLKERIRLRAADVRKQFKDVKRLLGAVSYASEEARQYMFFVTGLLALLRWFLTENRKRIDRFAKKNGGALRVLTHAIVRKYVRGREVYLGSDGTPDGYPRDSRRDIVQWNRKLGANIALEKRHLNDIKNKHLTAQEQWKDANYAMNTVFSNLSGMLSGEGTSTALSVAEGVTSYASVAVLAPGAREVITATKNVVGLLSYAVWRHNAKQALQQLNDALDSADEIKLLLEQDPQGIAVPGLAFRRATGGRPGGGRWDLKAAWEKRPRVLKPGAGVSTYTEIKGTEDFGDDDDLLNIDQAVVPYAEAVLNS
jgi:hypothetical protein